MNADPTAKYLAAYPPELRAQVRALIAEGRLADSLERRYPERHDIASDGALYDCVSALNAYFSPSWTAFQADRGRDFSVIVDGVSN